MHVLQNIFRVFRESVNPLVGYNIGDEGKTMTALLGQVGAYDASVETWEQYAERLGHFFDANSITVESKKHSVLLADIGPSTYTLLSSLVSPEKPGDKSFDDLVALLKNHFNPEPSEIVERYKYHTRMRQPKETVNDFVAELRALARHCNFGDSLNDLLRDRLVCGINDDAIQRRLLYNAGCCRRRN